MVKRWNSIALPSNLYIVHTDSKVVCTMVGKFIPVLVTTVDIAVGQELLLAAPTDKKAGDEEAAGGDKRKSKKQRMEPLELVNTVCFFLYLMSYF